MINSDLSDIKPTEILSVGFFVNIFYDSSMLILAQALSERSAVLPFVIS